MSVKKKKKKTQRIKLEYRDCFHNKTILRKIHGERKKRTLTTFMLI